MRIIFILSFILITSLSNAFARGIYGIDNRKEIFEIENPIVKDMAKSVATQINISNLSYDSNDGVITYTRTMGEEFSMCKDQKFVWQENPGECSGVLVGKDLLLTAGHCVRDELDCKKYKWLFGFSYKESFKEDLRQFKRMDLYSCKEIVESEYGPWTRKDFALIRLKKEVKNRKPLKYRVSGKISSEANLFTIGFPMGLPAKYAGQGTIGNNGNSLSFFTNLDTFVVNSGSPIFNSRTYEIEGVLIKGGRDIKFNSDEQCNRYFVEPTDSYKEEVFRVTQVPYLKK